MLTINMADIESNDADTRKALAEGICSSGLFYRDSHTGAWLLYNQGWVKAIPDKNRASTLLSELVQVMDRRGPAGLGYRGVIGSWLNTFIESNPHMFEAMPSVEGIVRLPALTERQGRFVKAGPGAWAGRLYAGAQVKLPEPDTSYPLLRQWLSDLRFYSPLHYGNLMGWVLAALVRPEIREFPFLVVDGTDRKVGKSRVASALAEFVVGRQVAPITFTGDEHEIEKRFGGLVGQPGPNLLFIDNVRPKRGQSGAIRSQLLAAMATSPSVAIRKNYGKEPEPIYYPLVVFTANEASVESDLHDRNVRVILTGAGRYFDPDPVLFVADNRLALLAEAFHLLGQIGPRAPGFKPGTRFRAFEWVARESARLLGLAADYQPDAVDTADNLVKELVSVVGDLENDGAGPPLMTVVAAAIMQNEDHLPELRALFRQARTTSDAAAAHVLRKFVEQKLGERHLHIGGKEVKFSVDKTKAGGYNLSLKPAI